MSTTPIPTTCHQGPPPEMLARTDAEYAAIEARARESRRRLWDIDRTGCHATEAAAVLQAARAWRATEQEIARVTRAQVWAKEQGRASDAARHAADLDRLYAESVGRRASLMAAVDAAAPKDACPLCGSPTREAVEDDGMAGVEAYGRIQHGEEWTERQCTECDWSEKIEDSKRAE